MNNNTTIELEVAYHKERFARNLLNCFIDKFLCDLILITNDGQRHEAHRIVFASASRHLKEVFTSRSETVIEINVPLPIDSINMQKFITYFYTGTIELTRDNATVICGLASEWKIDELCIACWHILKDDLTADNWIQAYELTEHICCTEIHAAIIKFFDQNFKEISKQESFKTLSSGELSELIARDSLNVSSEEEVFEAVLNWLRKFLEFDPRRAETFQTIKEKDGRVDELLSQIRFPLIEIEYFSREVEKICSYMQQDDLITEFYKFYSLKSIGSPLVYEIDNHRVRHRNPPLIRLFACNWTKKTDQFSIQVLSMRERKWLTVPNVSLSLRKITNAAVVLYNETQLIIIGGKSSKQASSDALSIDLATMATERLQSMKRTRYNHAAVVLNDNIYVTGGKNLRNVLLKSAEKWCPATKSWKDITSMLQYRYLHGLVASNNRLYAIGGQDRNNVLNSVECYQPEENSWKCLASMNKCRAAPGVAVLGNYLYVVGGSQSYGNGWMDGTDTVERYDIEKNEWTLIASINYAKSFVSLTILKCQLYSAGGYDSFGKLINTVEKYDADKNEWIPLPALNSINPLGLFTMAKKIGSWPYIDSTQV